ncbi:MAG: hypothetical protein HY471_00100 [Candidatus Sungbacteria bacterium]|nr:hypothetical protein [Candidatus Sungbacteria bacterium]
MEQKELGPEFFERWLVTILRHWFIFSMLGLSAAVSYVAYYKSRPVSCVTSWKLFTTLPEMAVRSALAELPGPYVATVRNTGQPGTVQISYASQDSSLCGQAVLNRVTSALEGGAISKAEAAQLSSLRSQWITALKNVSLNPFDQELEGLTSLRQIANDIRSSEAKSNGSAEVAKIVGNITVTDGRQPTVPLFWRAFLASALACFVVAALIDASAAIRREIKKILSMVKEGR